ncbi:MAG: hypothetical protein WD595_00370 [Waddliaceae bacterium]
MREDEPVFKDMVRELNEILAYIESNKDNVLKGDLPKGVEEMLETIEIETELFKLIGKQLVEEGKKSNPNPKELSSKEIRLQNQLEKMKEHAGELKKSVELQTKAAKSAEKKKPKKLSSKERKKKFKKIGGDGDWLPL